jgi:hypothetical protein
MCQIVDDAGGEVWVIETGIEGISGGTLDDVNGWTPTGDADLSGTPLGNWTVVDWQFDLIHGVPWSMVLDLAEGIYVSNGSQSDQVSVEAVTLVQAALGADADGRGYLCAVSEDGDLYFWHGEPGAMALLTLDPGVGSVDRCGIGASPEGLVVVAARGGDDLAIGGVWNAAAR